MTHCFADNLSRLEERIGYRFTDQCLLQEALTHRSYLNEAPLDGVADNERLEFFGDSVLSLFISHRLFLEFPDKREGELSRLRASLVDEAALAKMAEGVGIGECLRLGRGEERTGGRTKRSILADAYEALIGAIYLDGGADLVKPLIDRHYSHLAEVANNLSSERDSKTEFQELAQSCQGMTPHYVTTGTSGPDHARIFTVAAFLGDLQMGEGSGMSKKEAEQEAARQSLARLRQ